MEKKVEWRKPNYCASDRRGDQDGRAFSNLFKNVPQFFFLIENKEKLKFIEESQCKEFNIVNSRRVIFLQYDGGN